MMAATAKYRDDIAGAIVTGGTSTAYTVLSYEVFDTLAHLNGQMIAFTPHTTNGATVTLNVDSLGPKPLRSAPNVELLAGTIIQGTPYMVIYNNSDGAFYLQGFYGNPYNVPLLGGLDFWDIVTPNSSFIFPAGQAISRTTYAAAFARWGTTYGAGDGSTTFNVPDKTGRISAMKEVTATRLTPSYFGGSSTTLGSVGGAESRTLVAANLPPYTPAGTNSPSSTSTPFSVINSVNTTGSQQGVTVVGIGGNIGGGTAASQIFTGTAAPGQMSAPVATVQPTIICNYIIRII
jgi:microcystin-dependent protein